MKNKKIKLVFIALCCTLIMSACEKKQDNTNIPSSTTASKFEEKSGKNDIIDVFSEINVTFDGENGSGKVVCEYTGDNDFIKYDVEFKGDRNGRYKNGDTAVVKLDYSDLRAENANVYFKEKEHEYTVDGLWGVILSPDGYDFTECNKVLEERMFDKERSDSKFNIKELDIGNTFFTTFIDGEIDSTCWKILSVEYEPIRGKFLIPEYSSKISNYYYLFYQATVKCEEIEGDFVINPNSKYAVGDTKEWNFVICEETHNVFVEKGSKIIKIDPQAHRVVSYEVGAAIDVMSIESIYGKDSEIEYNNNFDEFFDKEICRYLENGTFYDIEIQ